MAVPLVSPAVRALGYVAAHANHRIGLICLAGFACCGFLAWNNFLVSSNKSIKIKPKPLNWVREIPAITSLLHTFQR
jgi:hypothetical protein